jgi:uncharacterized protein YbbC (DUF1343 family)
MLMAFSFGRIPVWEENDQVLKSGRVALLCNHSAWHEETGEYLFETFHKRGNLKRVFLPEHGLFGELQDQVKLGGKELYRELGFTDCEFVSLYGSDEASLSVEKGKLADLDALVIDLQDVGVRYYTFPSTLRHIFITLAKENIALPVWVVDRPRAAGPWVEGRALRKEYASFIGIEGLPQRHGLSMGELAFYFYTETGADFPLHVISNEAIKQSAIPPSPNIPTPFTCDFYSGQCLWEGTNVSEGRGTTRPFEVFGAPWMENLLHYNRKAGRESWNDRAHPLFDPGVALRWHRFIPIFHKYKDECCFGFQLIRRDPNIVYHALFHALRLIRFVRENCEAFSFRPGKYEAGNDKTAIELLAGDPFILDYLEKGSIKESELLDYFREGEREWIEKTLAFRLYNEELKSSASFYEASIKVNTD